jgi:hypothetical protein
VFAGKKRVEEKKNAQSDSLLLALTRYQQGKAPTAAGYPAVKPKNLSGDTKRTTKEERV